ncbi:MAG TPA: hypothetical protein VK590_05450 [Saprospiraceae bacterium]|nr:hypothetical protein [Saprospiraceae bacterium]
MKCTFISPHRCDVGRAKPAPDRLNRNRSDSGGFQDKKGWITSFCLFTAILFLGLNFLNARQCEGIKKDSRLMNPIHHEFHFQKDAGYKLVSQNEVLKWQPIVDSQVPILLIIERFSFDLSYAPEVKSSRMSNWSTDGGHPNTAEIYFKPETITNEHQFERLMNYRDNMLTLLSKKERNNKNSTDTNKCLASNLYDPASNIQTQYLTPLNPLLWLV